MSSDEAAAQHRRECERHKAGDQHRHRNRHRELVQQTSDQSTHEQHGNEHRRQRESHGNDGETDFLRTFQRRGKRRIARLNVAHDVFQHDDGVVHYKANTKRQRHERKVVQTVAKQRHHCECANE